MANLQKALYIPLLAAAIVASPARALDQEQLGREPTQNEVMADALIARPLGFFALLFGAATYIVALPFTLPSNSTDTAGEALIGKPGRYTFLKPIGQLDGCEALPETCKVRPSAERAAEEAMATEGQKPVMMSGGTTSRPGRE